MTTRDDYSLRLLVERLQREGASERAIEKAVCEVSRPTCGAEARRPVRRSRRFLRHAF